MVDWRKWTPDPHIYVQHLSWMNTEDSYEGGQDPNTTRTIAEESDLGMFENMEELSDFLSARYGIPTLKQQPNAYRIFQEEDGEARIDIDFLVDQENQMPSDKDIEVWKVGKKKLWSAYVMVHVLVGTFSKPDVNELAEITGLEVLE